MYIKKSKIEHVIQFVVDDNNLYYRDAGHCFFVNNKKIMDNTDDIKLINHSYISFFNRDYTKNIIYNLNTLQLKEISKNISITDNRFAENDFLSYKFSDDYMSFQFVTYNILEDKVCIETNLFNTYFSFYFDKKIISEDNNSIKLITLSGSELWQFPLSSLGGTEYEPGKTDKIEKILGIAHGNIWFYTDFGRLVALDLETGDVVKKISGNPSDKNSTYEMTLGLGDCFFRPLDKNIVSVSGFDFQIIDTEQLAVTEQYDFREADPMGIGTYRSIYSPMLQGDYFTFLGIKEEDFGYIRWIGIFDYKARKLVWEYEVISEEEFDETRNQLVPPQPLYMSGNKLYVKDIKDNLHIFEREDI